MLTHEIWQYVARHTVRRGLLRSDPRRVAVAIPTRNRAERILALVPRLVRDGRIGEIVVRDDASDPADFARLQEGLAPLVPRVRLEQNPENLGALANKRAVVADCRLDWAVLLDSDNRIGPDYLDHLYALPEWSARVIYCPERALPKFDFTGLSGSVLDLDALGRLCARRDVWGLSVFVNTGNYFVPTRAYAAQLAPFAGRRMLGADVCFANLAWLYGGGLLHVVPGLAYHHEVHAGSLFKETATPSKALMRAMIDAMASRDAGRVAALLGALGLAAPEQNGAPA